MADPAEKTKKLAAEVDRGRTARTPALALTGVTLFVAIAVVLLLAVALILYYAYGGGSNH